MHKRYTFDEISGHPKKQFLKLKKTIPKRKSFRSALQLTQDMLLIPVDMTRGRSVLAAFSENVT